MGLNQIKILPILIMVAMLAFSVRLVEFGVGVSQLSGSAMAADKKDKDAEKTEGEEKEEPEVDPRDALVVNDGLTKDDVKIIDDDPVKEMDDKMAKAEEKKPMKKMKEEKIDKPSIDWRDASDEEFGASNVRQEMFTDLTERRKSLDAQEKNLIAREALLKAAEQELNRKFLEMQQLRSEIENLLDKQSEEEQSRIASLVKVYEGMKPKDAARIFDTLDLDVLVAVMSRMSERKMSPILANMNPERARTVTILLAEEKQLPTLPGSS